MKIAIVGLNKTGVGKFVGRPVGCRPFVLKMIYGTPRVIAAPAIGECQIISRILTIIEYQQYSTIVQTDTGDRRIGVGQIRLDGSRPMKAAIRGVE